MLDAGADPLVGGTLHLLRQNTVLIPGKIQHQLQLAFVHQQEGVNHLAHRLVAVFVLQCNFSNSGDPVFRFRRPLGDNHQQ